MSALAIAKRLGYISVIDVLKLVTEETVSMVWSVAVSMFFQCYSCAITLANAIPQSFFGIAVISDSGFFLCFADDNREASNEFSRNSGWDIRCVWGWRYNIKISPWTVGTQGVWNIRISFFFNSSCPLLFLGIAQLTLGMNVYFSFFCSIQSVL